MPVISLKYKQNPNLNNILSNRSEYYLKLIIKQTLECLNSNGISYLPSGNAPCKCSAYKIKSSADISLATNLYEGAVPCNKHGIYILFTPGNPHSKRLAHIIKENLKNIYFDPSHVMLYPIKKQNKMVAPTENNAKVTISLGHIDNKKDLTWLKENTEEISQNIIMSLTQYFALPFAICMKPINGFFKSDANIFAKPSLKSNIVGFAPKDKKVKITGQWQDWYIVGKNYDLGYTPCKFVEII